MDRSLGEVLPKFIPLSDVEGTRGNADGVEGNIRDSSVGSYHSQRELGIFVIIGHQTLNVVYKHCPTRIKAYNRPY